MSRHREGDASFEKLRRQRTSEFLASILSLTWINRSPAYGWPYFTDNDNDRREEAGGGKGNGREGKKNERAGRSSEAREKTRVWRECVEEEIHSEVTSGPRTAGLHPEFPVPSASPLSILVARHDRRYDEPNVRISRKPASRDISPFSDLSGRDTERFQRTEKSRRAASVVKHIGISPRLPNSVSSD